MIKKIRDYLRKRKLQEEISKLSTDELCERKYSNIAGQVTLEYHQDKIHSEMFKITLSQGGEGAVFMNYKTSFDKEKGMITTKSTTASNPFPFVVNTTPQEVAAIKLAFFNYTCKECQLKEPRENCNANTPPVEKIINNALVGL